MTREKMNPGALHEAKTPKQIYRENGIKRENAKANTEPNEWKTRENDDEKNALHSWRCDAAQRISAMNILVKCKNFYNKEINFTSMTQKYCNVVRNESWMRSRSHSLEMRSEAEAVAAAKQQPLNKEDEMHKKYI